MSENQQEGGQPQTFSQEMLIQAILSGELDKMELEDAIEAANQMAMMKQAKGENEKAHQWKNVALEAQKKLQEMTANNEKTKVCPNCGSENRSIANFCSRCGTDIKAVTPPVSDQVEANQNKTCSNCGHVNRPSANFCAMCGNHLAG